MGAVADPPPFGFVVVRCFVGKFVSLWEGLLVGSWCVCLDGGVWPYIRSTVIIYRKNAVYGLSLQSVGMLCHERFMNETVYSELGTGSAG